MITLTPPLNRAGLWTPRRPLWVPSRRRLLPPRQRRLWLPRWWTRTPALLMADGDELVDDDGNEKLYDEGQEVPASATGSNCCCPDDTTGCNLGCTESIADAALTIAGWGRCLCFVTGGSSGPRANLEAGADLNGTYDLPKREGVCCWRLTLASGFPLGTNLKYFDTTDCTGDTHDEPILEMRLEVCWAWHEFWFGPGPGQDATVVSVAVQVDDPANMSHAFNGSLVVPGCKRRGTFVVPNQFICGDAGVCGDGGTATVVIP